MIMLYIFILGCFVSGIVLVGLVFAFAAAGYAAEDQHSAAADQDEHQHQTPGRSGSFRTPLAEPTGVQSL